MRVACIFFDQEVEVAKFAQACLRFSPQLALREPRVLWIEIGKCQKLYSEASFLARLQVLFRRFQYPARVVIADDLISALTLVLYQKQSIAELPLEALTEWVDPFHQQMDDRKTVQKMIESLQLLGIKTIEQFMTLPHQAFPSRFGNLGLYCREQLDFRAPILWPTWQPPETIRERSELNDSEYCSQIEPLLFKSKNILDRIFSRLRGKYLKADQIEFSIELEKHSAVKNPLRKWTFELITPQSTTSCFLPILRERLHWDLEREPIESDVKAVEVEITAFSVASDSQRSLFHTGHSLHDHHEYYENMGSLFHQIEECLGQGRVFWSGLTEERFPEKSWIKLKLPLSATLSIENIYPRRPTRIFTDPLPIFILDNRIVFKRRSFITSRWSAVERLHLDWMDDTPARNYYRVELVSGTLLWIFSDPGHHYFLHGYYG